MKKICYVISTLQKTGPVIVLYNLVKNLDRTRFEPYIITLSKEPEKSLLQDFQKLKVDVKSLNLSRISSFFTGPLKLKKIMKEIKPDIVHSHCFRSALFSATALKEYKRMVTVHCDYNMDFKMFYGNFLGYLMCRAMNFSLKRIKNNICVSKQLADILNKRNEDIEFNYIDNGTDTEVFKPAENKIELRKKLNLPTDKKIFIWCGAFIERKDPLTLVNVIKQIKNDKLFFVFCGNGNLEKICKDELRNNKNVLFTGYINNIKEYLQASDYHVSTSLSEGLPNGVLEALSCGLPCVLSNISQHEYILEHTKNIGLFFETQNSENLQNKINDILKTDYNLYSTNAVDLIQDKFSAKLMSKKYQKYYD
ncbi:MAG: glycosyltransferase [Elusimicrobia bacterium]|nr:glycosyltransferase [Elusimicrobiota bacterium]